MAAHPFNKTFNRVWFLLKMMILLFGWKGGELGFIKKIKFKSLQNLNL